MTITVHMQAYNHACHLLVSCGTVVDCCFWKPCVRLFPIRPQPKLKKMINEHSFFRCMFQALWFSLTNAGVVVVVFFFRCINEQKIREIGGLNSFEVVLLFVHFIGVFHFKQLFYQPKSILQGFGERCKVFLFQENCSCLSTQLQHIHVLLNRRASKYRSRVHFLL